MNDPYVPDAGHLVWLTLDPAVGHEKAGRRPFLVLSRRAYNAKTSFVVGVPITTKRKGYPFQVELPDDGRITGVAMADHIKSFDWRARRAAYAQDAERSTVEHVRRLIATLLDLRR